MQVLGESQKSAESSPSQKQHDQIPETDWLSTVFHGFFLAELRKTAWCSDGRDRLHPVHL